MKGRLGVYDKAAFEGNEKVVDGVSHQYSRLQSAGGNLQQERMIKDKRRSLDRAVWYSYQGAEVIKTDAVDRTPARALINPNKLKPDYDDKVISIGYEYEFAPGTVFEWVGTNSFWIVYLQDLTELAYFRGDIRRCSYQISWEDEDGEKHNVYAAVRGPVETKINYIQKHGVSVDTPNHSLHLLMPQNDGVLEYFKRYGKFYLQGYDTCWRVEATDAISMPGILEITAVEYYANETEDDIENGIVGGLIEEVQEPNTEEVIGTITGDTFIKPKRTYVYNYTGEDSASWNVDSKYPVELVVEKNNPKQIIVKWTAGYSGQFDLFYGEIKRTIVVESLF